MLTKSPGPRKRHHRFESNDLKRDPKLRRRMALAESLFNVKYDLMEFNDLLDDDRFVESYNHPSRMKGRQMAPKVKTDGCYFELQEMNPKPRQVK